MTFEDEDHPKWDSWYDDARIVIYQRVQDIEKFTIFDDTITYVNIWSDDKSYSYLKYGAFSQHADHVGDFERIMYVANTWNHSMDTENTNPDLKQKFQRFR